MPMVFGCLVCKEAFYTDEHYRENKAEERNAPILTACGHYFHLSCIQGAFIHETLNSSTSGPKRKSCPFSKCGKDLHNTSLIKIHPEEIHHDSSKKKIADLQSELLYLKHCVEKTASFEAGDKVIFNSGNVNNGTTTGIGIVKQIMVEIQLENGGDPTQQNNNTAAPWKEILNNKLINSIQGSSSTPVNKNGNGNTPTSIVLVPKNKVKLAPSTSHQVQQMQSVAIKLETQANGVRKPAKNPKDKFHKYPEVEEFSHLRPKWEAGDRIYLLNDKEYATIKWIGSRDYTFVVVIEFDNPVGDVGIQTDDLPFLIKDGFGRRLTIDQLNENAQKVSNTILAKIHRWGSNRIRNGTLRPSIFHLNENSTPHNDKGA